MSDRMLNANTATAEELKGIPGVNDKIAQLILRFKEIYGVVRKEALILALRGDISPDVLDQIDFSLPRIDDPFDLDCLPAVPKTNFWEKPMVSFNKQQMASRQSSPHESRSRSPESLDNLLEFYEKMSSPFEKTLALLKKEFSDKEELHPSRTSHTSPVNKKGDKRQLLGSRQTHTSNDRTTCGSKSTGGPSASSRVKSKLSTARDSRSRCSSGSRSPDSHRSAIKQKTTKTRKSSESRSRSPSSKKVARQQKKIKTRNSSRSRGRKSRSNRSYSRSSSRSKSRSGHHSKRSYRKVVKKNRSSSRSGSRSSSVRYHSRKSKKSHKRSRADSRSSSRSPSQSVGQDSTSRTRHHSKRKVVRKNRKSRSDSRSTRHSRKSVLKHWKTHRRSRSISRSSSRSSSRSLSSHSRSHKGHTRSQKMKHRNRHKKRHNSSSSTSSSSSLSPSRSHWTKRSKSRKSKRSSSSSSQSPSRSRSHQAKRSKSRKSKRSSSSYSRSRSQSRKKTRSHKSKRSKSHTSSSSDSDISDHRHSYRHGNPRKHPKALRFDGKTNWLSFKKKFNSYRKVMKWSETESKDYLMWSLEGKALDFFTITSDIEKYSFRRIIKKLEARFGVKELTETSKVKFQQASQRPDESLEDWADRVMTLATPAFVDLPEDHLKQEAIAKFSQGCCDKDAGKHACFEHPSTMEEALNLVKHHQYISQAVDGKQSKKGNDVSVNAVQSTSEDRIEQLIASALKEFASKLQVSPQPYQQSADEKWKSSVQCFFCKNFGHFKKECRIYQSWLQKQQSKADNLSDQGQDKESTYETYQIGKVSILNRKNIEHQHSKESKLIDRASCSKYITDSDSMASKPAGTNSKSRLKKRSQAKNVAVDSGTSSTKIVQKMFQGGTFSTKTDRTLQDGTSSTKTEQKFQDGNLQGGTSSTKTDQKFQDGNLQDGTSCTKTDQKFQDGNLQGGTSSTKTDQKFQDRNLQDGTSSTKTVPKFQDGTSSTKTDRNLQDGTSSAKTVPKFQDGTSSTKTDRNLQDGTSSAKTVPKFQDGTSSTKTDRNLQDGTSSAKTVPKFQDGTSSTKTDKKLQDGTSSAKTVPKIQDGTFSTKTDGNLQGGTSSTKIDPKFQEGAFSTKTDKKLQEGTFSAKTVRNFQDDTYCTKTDGEFLNYKREESVYIHQVRAGSSFVQLKVGSIDINARIDLGAEITILSSKIYEKLNKAPAKVKEVGLQMADKDTVMKGFIIQPLKMKLGNQCFSERVYVASIGDDMLLGHDLLHHLGVCLDMRTDTLILNGEQIPVTTSFNNNTPTVARVSVKQKVRLPPNTRSRKQHQSIGRASSSPMFHRQK